MKGLDLFSCAGGVSKGLTDAGFVMYGVDKEPRYRKRYPYAFHCGDALDVLRRLIAGEAIDFTHKDGTVEWLYLTDFVFITASPPCQAYSITKHSHSNEYPMLVEPVRALLIETGLPYVIENVVGAPLLNPITLCGTHFDLTTVDDDGTTLYLKRHRLFESNVLIYPPNVPGCAGKAHCRCSEFKRRGWYVGGVYGGGSVDRSHAQHVRRGGYTPSKDKRAALIGADWMTQDQLSQAIPPAYTEHIGRQLMAHLQEAAA